MNRISHILKGVFIAGSLLFLGVFYYLDYTSPPPHITQAICNKSKGDADCKADAAGNAVTLADYQIWRSEYFAGCTAQTLSLCGADEDGDGIAMDADFSSAGAGEVTILDFEIWRKGYFEQLTPIAACPIIYPGSYWNIPIASLGAQINPSSQTYIDELLVPDRPLKSATNAYTFPVYLVNSSQPGVTVRVANLFSNVTAPGVLVKEFTPTLSIPFPPDAQAAAGTDGHIIVVNTQTGDEWGFWKGIKQADGSWDVTNGYHYNVNWNGEVPAGFGSRGAGLTYMAGLIRRCEASEGVIRHAIAFGYTFPCGARATGTCRTNGPEFVYPATKSDGKGDEAWAMPEGARLYIDPPPTETELGTWCGADAMCRMMAQALTDYGMIVIDNAGDSKLYAESSLTADWTGVLNQFTPSKIPLSRFKVLDFISSFP